ncbi:MAG: pilus assembly protein TadG-related protein, partial [Telluria sp.]
VVKDGKYVEGSPEPAAGYTRFAASSWPSLYTPGAQQLKSGQTYPLTPYLEKIEAPAGAKGVANRRVLNVPLLRCPVPSGAPTGAEVLAIARFFMTVSATNVDLHAEFAGLAPQHSLAGQVRLF